MTSKERTPLPKLPTSCAILVQVAEAMNVNVLFPFVAFMVEDMGYTGKQLGYYAGGIAAAFCFGQFLSSVFWGKISDWYGRKPAIICGTFGTALGQLVFGMSKTYPQAVLGRLLSGLLCGNIGVLKSFIVEITDDSNRGSGFAMMSLSWSIGCILAPLAGGLLCRPAQKYPQLFSQDSIFAEYPYLLPCLVCTCYNLFCVAYALLVMPETRRLKRSKSTSSADEEMKSTSSPSSVNKNSKQDALSGGLEMTRRLPGSGGHRFARVSGSEDELDEEAGRIEGSKEVEYDEPAKMIGEDSVFHKGVAGLITSSSIYKVGSKNSNGRFDGNSTIYSPLQREDEEEEEKHVQSSAQDGSLTPLSGWGANGRSLSSRTISSSTDPADYCHTDIGSGDVPLSCEIGGLEVIDIDELSEEARERAGVSPSARDSSGHTHRFHHRYANFRTGNNEKGTSSMQQQQPVKENDPVSGEESDEDDIYPSDEEVLIFSSCTSRKLRDLRQSPGESAGSASRNILLYRNVFVAANCYGVLAMAYMVLDETIPLFLKSDVSEGGLSYGSSSIGSMLSVCGFIMLVYCMLVLPTVAAQSKTWLFRIGAIGGLTHVFLWPLVGVLNKALLNHVTSLSLGGGTATVAANQVVNFDISTFLLEAITMNSTHSNGTNVYPPLSSGTSEVGWLTVERVQLFVGFLLVCVCVYKSVCATFLFTAIQIQLSHSVYDQDLGTVNGFGQSLAALSRGIGPAVGGALWSLSVTTHFVFINFIAVALLIVICWYANTLLPLSLDFKKKTREELKKQSLDGGGGDDVGEITDVEAVEF